MDDINDHVDVAFTNEQVHEWNRRTNDMRSSKVRSLGADDLVAHAEAKVAERDSQRDGSDG